VVRTRGSTRADPTDWGTAATIFALIALCGCGSVPPDEVTRATSPSGVVDAMVTEANGGATTSYYYEVYVAPKGASIARGTRVAWLYGAVRNSGAYGVNLLWLGPEELRVEYLSAKGQDLTVPSAAVAGHRIRVSLNPGVFDSKAPAGGMLDNKQR
jgi:hypothetical protein